MVEAGESACSLRQNDNDCNLVISRLLILRSRSIRGVTVQKDVQKRQFSGGGRLAVPVENTTVTLGSNTT